MKKKSDFLSENFHFFWVVKFSVYLNRRVFVMVSKTQHLGLFKQQQNPSLFCLYSAITISLPIQLSSCLFYYMGMGSEL